MRNLIVGLAAVFGTVSLSACTTVSQGRDSVKEFMIENQLEAMGITPGYLTRYVPLEVEEIKDIQLGLRTLNCYDGEVDGIAGPNTMSALKIFVESNGNFLSGIGVTPENIKLSLDTRKLVMAAARRELEKQDKDAVVRNTETAIRSANRLRRGASIYGLSTCETVPIIHRGHQPSGLQ